MFRGVHNLTIDAKGRLKIPTRHQAQIDKACAGKWNNFWKDGKADGIGSNLSRK